MFLKKKHANLVLVSVLGRSEGDSNPRYAFGVYTLSSSGSRRFSKLIIKYLMFSISVGANVAQTRIFCYISVM